MTILLIKNFMKDCWREVCLILLAFVASLAVNCKKTTHTTGSMDGIPESQIKTSRFHKTVTISPEVSNAAMDSESSSAGTSPTGGDNEKPISVDELRNLHFKYDVHAGSLTGQNYGLDFRPGINIFTTLKDDGAGLDVRFAHAWNFGAQAGVEVFKESNKVKPSISLGYNLSYIKLRNTDIVVTYAFNDVLLGLRVEL